MNCLYVSLAVRRAAAGLYGALFGVLISAMAVPAMASTEMTWPTSQVRVWIEGAQVMALNTGPYFFTVAVTPSSSRTHSGMGEPIVAAVPPYSKAAIAQAWPGLDFACPEHCDILAGALDADGGESDGRLYSLPYDDGQVHRVSQAYGGILTTHTGSMAHAVDFEMPVGTPVRAARGGRVLQTEASFNEGGTTPDMMGRANYVAIQHSDGSIALYAHLQHNGVVVQAGQVVEEGDLLGYSGNTGYSSGPHLHFSISAPHVDSTGRLADLTLPVRFRIGPEGGGEPPTAMASMTGWFDGRVTPDEPMPKMGVPKFAVAGIAPRREFAPAGAGRMTTDGLLGSRMASRAPAPDSPGPGGKLAWIGALLLLWKLSRAARGV